MKRLSFCAILTILSLGTEPATARDDYYLTYNFGDCNERYCESMMSGGGNKTIDDCVLDECYDTSSHECYYDDGISDNGYCTDTCANYGGSNTYIVWCDIPGCAHVPMGCGCKKVTSVEWRASGTGRERKYTTTNTDCDGNKTTTATSEYRCAAGYYGNGTTCTRCPGQKNTAGTTVHGNSPAGATALSQCALPVGTYTDATGTFTISSPCPHD